MERTPLISGVSIKFVRKSGTETSSLDTQKMQYRQRTRKTKLPNVGNQSVSNLQNATRKRA